MFDGVCPVVNVPFHADETIDFNGLSNIIEYVIEKGCKSICLFAFNSEPYKLSLEEKKETITRFLGFVNGRIETLIGIVENSIADCTALGETAKRGGADGIILYPPALSTPPGEGLVSYFKTIAERVDLPVMIQDNPRSTGVTMSLEMLLSTFRDIDQFRFLKVECPIPMRKMSRIVEETNGELKCYSGNGGIFAVDAFLSGASGIMPGVVLCGEFHRMLELLSQKETDKARDMFERILPLTWYEDQSLEFYISCEKYLLKQMGIIDNDTVRKPEVVLSEKEKKELLTLYQRTKQE